MFHPQYSQFPKLLYVTIYKRYFPFFQNFQNVLSKYLVSINDKGNVWFYHRYLRLFMKKWHWTMGLIQIVSGIHSLRFNKKITCPNFQSDFLSLFLSSKSFAILAENKWAFECTWIPLAQNKAKRPQHFMTKKNLYFSIFVEMGELQFIQTVI